MLIEATGAKSFSTTGSLPEITEGNTELKMLRFLS